MQKQTGSCQMMLNKLIGRDKCLSERNFVPGLNEVGGR